MDRKTEIILATLELASENGLGTVSMNQIAERLGISKPALYNHFSSRDEIIREMYSFLRGMAKRSLGGGEIDCESLAEGASLKKILTQTVDSYRRICSNPEMFKFYKIIMSQRTLDKAAAEIMVMETNAMVETTRRLFYALQVKHIADFPDADAAAFSFAMLVRSIIDYELDLRQLDENSPLRKKNDCGMMKEYIEEFCRIYTDEGGKKYGKK